MSKLREGSLRALPDDVVLGPSLKVCKVRVLLNLLFLLNIQKAEVELEEGGVADNLRKLSGIVKLIFITLRQQEYSDFGQ